MKNTKELTRYAIYLAIITMFAQIPQLGFISLGVVAITTMPIIIVPMLLVENNWKSAFFISITWGLNAWLAAVFRGATTIDIWFRNPLIGLVPRILAGLIAYAIITNLIKMSRKKLIKDFRAINVFIFISTITTFGFIGTSFPNGGNHLVSTIWVTTTGLIGLLLALKTYKTIDEHEGSACSFVLGFLSGITIAVVHTSLVLLSIKLFINDADNVKLFLDYVIKTSAIIEISVTAFITMSIWPSLAALNIKKESKVCK